MRVLLLFTVVTFGNAAQLAKGGGPGTQTVLLIKGGVGYDVNLLSLSPETVRHKKDEQPQSVVESQAHELEAEQKTAADLTASLQNTVDSSKKLEDQVRSLKARAVKAEKLLSKKDQELKQLKKKEAAVEKNLQVKSKMLLHEHHETDLLKKKVKELEKDIEISNKAWKEAADHEKEVAEAAQETATEEAAKNDRLTQQIPRTPQKKVPSVAQPKSKPSHRKFMKSLKKQTAKLAKQVAPQADVDVEEEPDLVDSDISDHQTSDITTEENAQVDEQDIRMHEDIAPDSDIASDANSEDQTEVPAEDEPMPLPEKQPAQRAVVKPPTMQATGGAADVQSNSDKVASESMSEVMTGPSEVDDVPGPADAEDSESSENSKVADSSADAEAEKEDDPNWTLAYSPEDRAATDEEAEEGDAVEKEAKDAESDDVLSPDAPMPVEEDPTDTVKATPDMMGRV